MSYNCNLYAVVKSCAVTVAAAATKNVQRKKTHFPIFPHSPPKIIVTHFPFLISVKLEITKDWKKSTKIFSFMRNHKGSSPLMKIYNNQVNHHYKSLIILLLILLSLFHPYIIKTKALRKGVINI